MPAGEIPAAALTDLRADSNALSFWRVEPDESNLSTVITALASNRDRLDKIDYALLDEAVLLNISIGCEETEGNTPYAPQTNIIVIWSS